MLKKATLLLLLVTLVSSNALLATIANTASYSSSYRSINDCTPIENTLLNTSNTSDTYCYVYSPQSLGGVSNQFRYRPVGTSLWLFSSIRSTYYRLLKDLQPGTLYEFQVSYLCSDRGWSDFSNSNTFRTTGTNLADSITVEVSDTTIQDMTPIDTMRIDSTMLETEDLDTIETITDGETIDNSMMDMIATDTIMLDSTMLETGAIDTTEIIDTLGIGIIETDSLHLDSIGIIDLDSSSTSPRISIGDATFTCGDSILCISVKGSDFSALTSIGFAIAWDTASLQLVSIAPNEEMLDTVNLSNITATDLMGGVFPYIWHPTSDTLSTPRTHVEFFTLCFTPMTNGLTTIHFVDSLTLYTFENTDSILLDTFQELLFQAGSVTIDDCAKIQSGGATCDPPKASGLSTSSTDENATYIQSSLQGQVINNQFRYRQTGQQSWIYTPIDSVHFRYITELTSGTTYEFQVSIQCPDSTYSDYSSSLSFTTLGGINNSGTNNDTTDVVPIISSNCEPIPYEDLGVSTIKQFFAYIYTSQPYGVINNQFRYRVVGRTFWLYTSISATYYRYLMGLEDGQLYEYQVSHECTPGVWSPFSVSYKFETLPSINFNSTSTSRLGNIGGISSSSKELSLQVFPNPATQDLVIALEQPLPVKSQLTVLNVQGQVVKNAHLSLGQQQHVFAIDDLLEGMYIVRLEAGNLRKSSKFVKQ